MGGHRDRTMGSGYKGEPRGLRSRRTLAGGQAAGAGSLRGAELCAVPSEPPAASCPPSEDSEESTPLVSDLEFWGGEQILPSAPVEPLPGSDNEWQQPASFNKPGQVNPADVPLPEDPMEHQDGAPQNRPDCQEESHVQSLKDLLRRQESQMQEVLEAMKRLDGGNGKTSRLIAYKKASDAIKDGLEAIGRECEKRGKQEREGVELDLTPEELRIKRERIQKWARQCVEDGMCCWTCSGAFWSDR
ncbi:uncharacterized protein [Patagioenas fasciata]|uniref:uncharacterized protein n=1 Tax=Patagioenas fasciata TaxID=372321 RepID=UPI003A99EBF6